MSEPQGPIVFFAPLGHDGRLYAPLARALGNEVEVVCVDYPGFGTAARDFDYTAPDLLERLTCWLAEQIARLSRPPVGLGGVSIGGTLSLRVANLLPQPPAFLFLVSSGGVPVARIRRETVRAAMAELGALGFTRKHLGLDNPDLTVSSLRQHLGEQLSAETLAYFSHYFHEIWRAEHFEARALGSVAMLDAALDVDYRPEMAACHARSHVIWGDRDRVFSSKFVARLTSALTHTQLHVLPSIGHYPPLEAPLQVAAIIRAALGTEEKSHD